MKRLILQSIKNLISLHITEEYFLCIKASFVTVMKTINQRPFKSL